MQCSMDFLDPIMLELWVMEPGPSAQSNQYSLDPRVGRAD